MQPTLLEKTESCGERVSERTMETAVEPPSLMIVLSDERERRALEAIVSPCSWAVYHATSCEEAIRFARHTRPSVLICDAELADGGWRRIWKALSIGPHPPQFIVASRTADERLWSQVLNVGGHDVLVKPFRREEVVWSIHCASAQRECAICHPEAGKAS